ncbi:MULTISPECIES: histidinol-phosphatase [Psychrilyobacter]|uniref:Histidinol-phosphatase n=1 Tax=Psychrilyobacter piezotolerans TaxID=2293438 RepID=A0ABX9KF40_9FUSO|nr:MULTISPECIES: histidinol-phosphatase [Psychrilyobacter]MCS5421280.1 histidinol-phosphatase [Psychrilyobacter sp. S5]NDI78143.1 histidinol-phosphatase [Psychrilyobacter piezotolerans]RDE60165.1 hippurate hydrolase [Psychrilyobacter sp. S5]REI40347.1 hippurate hydrolase [Psychrilyobacter piezotolerans]
MKKTNYHTHHYRCKHAEGEIIDYVNFAIKTGINELGMSCHVPYKDGRLSHDRMEYSDLLKYFQEIDQAKEVFKDFTLLKALECEYFEDSHDYYLELKEKTDYLILGQHYLFKEGGEIVGSLAILNKENLYQYRDDLIKGIKSGIFDFLAHPDLFMARYPEWDSHCKIVTEDILASCRKHDMPIEYNANGLRYDTRDYPNNNFWEYVADNYRDIKVIVNSDTHSPEALDDEFVSLAKKRVKEMGLNHIELLQTRKKKQRDVASR